MNKKVLIVDDDPSVRQLIKVSLRNYEVIEVSNGLDALEKVSSEQPDLILLDVMMPKMNGFEVVKQLRADPASEKIPIIILTARGDQSTLEQGQEVGVSDYFTKPFSPRLLAEKVDKIIGEKKEEFS